MRRLAETKHVLETNDRQVVRAAALEHLGILMQQRTIIHEDVVAGRLVPVLTEWGLQRVIICGRSCGAIFLDYTRDAKQASWFVHRPSTRGGNWFS